MKEPATPKGVAESPPADDDPKAVSRARKVLELMADMRTPHTLMPGQPMNQVFGTLVLFGIGTTVFAMVRSFLPATPNPIAENAVTILMSYNILAVSGVVALRHGDRRLVFEDWAKFSSLTFALLLASSFLYAVTYGVSTHYLEYTPVAYFNDEIDPIFIRFTYAMASSALIVGLLSWRSRRIHRAIWRNVKNKAFWCAFYTLIVAIAITLVASL